MSSTKGALLILRFFFGGDSLLNDNNSKDHEHVLNRVGFWGYGTYSDQGTVAGHN